MDKSTKIGQIAFGDSINDEENKTAKCIDEYYKVHLQDYEIQKEKITRNIEGRICHHKVLVLDILRHLYDLNYYAEIGTHSGASLSYCVLNEKRLNAFAIDLFEDTFGHYLNDNLSLESTKQNLQRTNSHNHDIRYIKGNSNSDETENKLKESLNSNELDLLFIDGDHTYEGVKNDFERFSKYVKRGGFIVVDDFNIRYASIVTYVYNFLMNNETYKVIGVFLNNELILKKLN